MNTLIKSRMTISWMVSGIGIAVFLQSTVTLGGIVVIGNPANKNHLTEDQVAKIFLGKSHEFPDGTSAKPVDQAEGRASREEFLTKILNKNERTLKSYWSMLVFTGNGTPPETLADDQAVKKFVSSNSEAIGYIDSKEVDASVKVIFSGN